MLHLLAGHVTVEGVQIADGDRGQLQIADSDRVPNWVIRRDIGGQISRICGRQLAQTVLGVVGAAHIR
ncbi:MAG TPA: hypothetical protein VF070_04915 [Streptosporangiaceae bacterium]